MRIGCLGMATLDTLLFTSGTRPAQEAIVRVDEAIACVGGKGIVTAIAIRQAGVEVRPFSIVGNTSTLTGMLPGDVEQRYLLPLLDRDHKTWIAISGEQEVVTFVDRGGLDRAGEETALAALDEFLADLDALYVTAEDPSLLRRTLDLLPVEVKMALNPTMPLLEDMRREPDLLADLVRRANMVLCNDWEAPGFLGLAGAQDWRDLDAPVLDEVVVTGGEAGGVFSDAAFGDWQRFEAVPAEARCVVGAGDTFNGAYLTARMSGASQRESCGRAAEMAAVKVSHKSSTLPF